MLHSGEMVLPPELAASVRSILAGTGYDRAPNPIPDRGLHAGRSTESPAGTNIQNLNVTVPVHGLLRAETPKDVAEVLRRAAAQGYIVPRKPRGAVA